MNVHAPISARDLLAGVKIIDADTHVSEPWDLWTSRAPKHLKDRVPRFVETDGVPHWVIDHDTFLAPLNGYSAIMRDGSKVLGYDFNKRSVAEVHEGASSLPARLKYMDEQGIYAQIAYPNLLGFGGQKAQQIDEDLRIACIRIFNDAMAEWQAQSNGRFYPMALLPWWNVEESVAEAKRCADMGLRGVNINSDPHLYNNLPPLGDTHWDPLWRAAVDYDLPVNFHIGASDSSMSWQGDSPWPSLDTPTKLAMGSTMMFISNAKVLCNLIASGLLERFPKLKFVSVESGVGWIPFIMEALDYSMREAGAYASKRLSMSPMEYFRRQIYACFWFENQDFSSMIRKVGVDNCMFETDYPHPTCLYPNPLEHAGAAMAELTAQERAKVLSLNAAGVYNIPLQ